MKLKRMHKSIIYILVTLLSAISLKANYNDIFIGSMDYNGQKSIVRITQIEFSGKKYFHLHLPNKWIYNIELDEFYATQDSVHFKCKLNDKILNFSASNNKESIIPNGEIITTYNGNINNSGKFKLHPVHSTCNEELIPIVGKYHLIGQTYFLVSYIGRDCITPFYSDGYNRINIFPIGLNTFLTPFNEYIVFHEDSLSLKSRSYTISSNRVNHCHETELIIKTSQNNINATLLTPLTNGPFPLIIFIQPPQVENRHYARLFADRIVEKGFAALTFDMNYEHFNNYYNYKEISKDIIDIYEFSKRLPEVFKDRIAFWSINEGMWPTIIAAENISSLKSLIITSGYGVSPINARNIRIQSALDFYNFDPKWSTLIKLAWEQLDEIIIEKKNSQTKNYLNDARIINSSEFFSRIPFILRHLPPNNLDMNSKKEITVKNNNYESMNFDPIDFFENNSTPILFASGTKGNSTNKLINKDILYSIANKKNSIFHLFLFENASHELFVMPDDLNGVQPEDALILNTYSIYPDTFFDVIDIWLENNL